MRNGVEPAMPYAARTTRGSVWLPVLTTVTLSAAVCPIPQTMLS